MEQNEISEGAVGGGYGERLEENGQKELKQSETMKSKRWRRFKISYDILKQGLAVFQRKLQNMCG